MNTYNVRGYPVVVLNERDRRRDKTTHSADGFPKGIDEFDYPGLTDFNFANREIINTAGYIIYINGKLELNVLKDRGFDGDILDEINNFINNELRSKKLKQLLYD